MGKRERRRCQHCGQAFVPDARNARHQHYCAAPECRAASKRASQAKWLAKSENRDYYRGPLAVARVQAWRAAHPGYHRRPTPITATPAPMPVDESPPVVPDEISCNAAPGSPGPPLQDVLHAQPIVLVGLIAHLFGSPLQEDIASTVVRLVQLGQDICGGEGHDDQQTNPGTGAVAYRAGAL
jgi:hypothetical protein